MNTKPSDSSFLKTVKKELLSQTEDYVMKYDFDSKDFLVATTLDPVYKNLNWIDSKREKNSLYKSVSAHISEQIDLEDLESSIENQTQILTQAQASQVQPRESLPFNLKDALFGSSIHRTNIVSNSGKSSVQLELEAHAIRQTDSSFHEYYLSENKEQSPRLREAAIHFLTPPATSVPSERLFSGAGFIVSDRRNRLGPDTTEDTMLIYENLNVKYKPEEGHEYESDKE